MEQSCFKEPHLPVHSNCTSFVAAQVLLKADCLSQYHNRIMSEFVETCHFIVVLSLSCSVVLFLLLFFLTLSPLQHWCRARFETHQVSTQPWTKEVMLHRIIVNASSNRNLKIISMAMCVTDDCDLAFIF